ncbi:dynamin family protein [Caryophanon latum]|uniref:Dynamin N-terminal domain-containing protein n=1 Tax=Caryophanon latum TaxID=33977 RepID=A0A1C0YZC3_9BACL|nr:dynamin family protein [Caryophanon latum]OCS92489.1 hypothetical protein A6K76_06280 [Caryophanon latum]
MIQLTRKSFEEMNESIKNILQEARFLEEALILENKEVFVKSLNTSLFKIAVIAPFSTGKSTFINSLLGFDLLSTSILVETAAITTVKYAESPRAEINYNDGSQKVIKNIEDLFEFKEEIRRYTAVNRDNDKFEVEDEISHVDIYWPIDLCKHGIEIVDTPGLFAQYEKHSDITLNILKSVNAVIFLMDPTTIGEVNFMKVIREYVENAKKTTMDNSDKHIFFVVNKIDQYPNAEVEKAYTELKKVLENVVKSPKIFKVSSYFGLMAKMYEDGHITLMDLRKAKNIKFVDHEGFPVSGRSINEKDVRTIKRISNIQSIYDSLVTYFERQYIQKVFQEAQLSKEVLSSTNIKENLNRLNKDISKVAVIGPYNSGKTTFINSLIGNDLLSTSFSENTATITTIKYAESPRAEINYYDKSQVIIHGDQDDLFSFKNELKNYTALIYKDECEVESSISHVDIYGPFDLCRNGVEFIDTPELSISSEEHREFLEFTNTVVFIVDPGHINCQYFVLEYVEKLKRMFIENSNMHIFFVINKIDLYSAKELEKAYNDLKVLLKGIVSAPKIFKVSSYFALKAKMFEEGHISINKLQNSRGIKFVDVEGFPVSGKSISDGDVPTIKRISNIQSIEDSLCMDIEGQNSCLIQEAWQKLNGAIELELEKVAEEIQLEEHRHRKKIKALKDKVKKLNMYSRKEIKSGGLT